MKTKFRRIFTVVLMLCLVFSLCFAMTACNKTVDKLTSELGVVIEGEFDKGAQLVTEPIEVTGEKGKNVIALLEEKEYAKEGEVRIFDISVVIPHHSRAKADTLPSISRTTTPSKS